MTPVPELALDYVRVLAWPSVTIAAIIIFRVDIKDAFSRISEANIFGNRLAFGEKVAELKQRAEAQAPAISLAPDAATTQLLDVIRENPSAGLALLRMRIEAEIRQIYEGQGSRPGRGLRQVVEELLAVGALSRQTGSLILDFLPLANRAVHGEQVRPDDANQVVDIGLRVLTLLRNEPPPPAGVTVRPRP